GTRTGGRKIFFLIRGRRAAHGHASGILSIPAKQAGACVGRLRHARRLVRRRARPERHLPLRARAGPRRTRCEGGHRGRGAHEDGSL
ncbi:unnamed protein product, partial [Pelagomonas calceolata]